MPMVGGEKFPYTAAGKKKAAKAARKIKGTPIPMPKKDSNLVGNKPKTKPKKLAPKKMIGKYGQIGRA
jgi:hypothetical protein